MIFERRRAAFAITTDRARFDVSAIHAFLCGEAYWSLGIPRGVVEKAIEGSLCFGLLEGSAQIGFARAVTDGATFAWICDVYVLEAYRGKGLALWLVRSALEHPDLQGLRRIVLATRDAHGLYRRAGFGKLAAERWMAIDNPDPYGKASTDA